MRPLVRFVRVLGVAVLVTACAGSQRWMTGVPDYEQYRKIRLAKGVGERLKQGWRYLKAHPQGAFREEVEPWFSSLEEHVRHQGWNYEVRLQEHLDALPDGPFAQLVRARLEELKTLRARKVSRERAFLEAERGRGETLELAKTARADFIRGVQQALAEILSIREFGEIIAAWRPELKARFFDQSPPGYCEGTRCSKRFAVPFVVPAGRALATRVANFEIVLFLKGDRLAAVELSGEALFTRLSEAATLQVVAHDDLQGRTEAISTAVQLLALTIDAEFPESDCAQQAVSPIVLSRKCGGRVLTVVVADGSETDRVRIVSSVD